jgi:hypothetical protein
VLAEAAAADAEKYEMLFDDQIEYIKVRGLCVFGGGHMVLLGFIAVE